MIRVEGVQDRQTEIKCNLLGLTHANANRGPSFALALM